MTKAIVRKIIFAACMLAAVLVVRTCAAGETNPDRVENPVRVLVSDTELPPFQGFLFRADTQSLCFRSCGGWICINIKTGEPEFIDCPREIPRQALEFWAAVIHHFPMVKQYIIREYHREYQKATRRVR